MATLRMVLWTWTTVMGCVFLMDLVDIAGILTLVKVYFKLDLHLTVTSPGIWYLDYG